MEYNVAGLPLVYAEEFAKAENALKEYEHMSNEALVPSVNELRYAGSHAAQAVRAQTGEQAEEEWRRAIRHAKRARYDVMEFYISWVGEKVKAVQESYKGYEYLAAGIIPNYLLHVKKLRALADAIDKVHELDKESDGYCMACRRYVDDMNAFLDDFTDAQEVLFKAIKEKEDGGKIAWAQCIASAVIGALLSWIIALIA